MCFHIGRPPWRGPVPLCSLCPNYSLALLWLYIFFYKRKRITQRNIRSYQYESDSRAMSDRKTRPSQAASRDTVICQVCDPLDTLPFSWTLSDPDSSFHGHSYRSKCVAVFQITAPETISLLFINQRLTRFQTPHHIMQASEKGSGGAGRFVWLLFLGLFNFLGHFCNAWIVFLLVVCHLPNQKTKISFCCLRKKMFRWSRCPTGRQDQGRM